jgi:SIR2-like protein
VDFVNKDINLSSHRSLVRKVARRGNRKPRTKIFTTNYDLCFEQAARQQQFVLIDGFSHSTPQVYDRAHFSYDIVRRQSGTEGPDYVENVFQLYKLHGSLDWRRSGTTILRSRDAADGDPVLIYPRDTKFQEAFESPYLDMMGALQAALREPDTALIVSGFGFNDDHISKPVMAAVEANMSLMVVVCDVAFLDDNSLVDNPTNVDHASPMRVKNPYFTQWRDLANDGDKRITLINGRFEDLADAIPDLVAQTERERHSDRMQRVRGLPEERSGRDKA